MKKVLIVCSGNSSRSQMAEGWVRYYGGDQVEVFSAGIAPRDLDLNAVRVMMDSVIDISGHTSKGINQLSEKNFDYIITLCDKARENCPDFPGSAIRLHHSFPDPAIAEGTEEDKLKIFAGVRDMIEDFAFDFVNENIRGLIPHDPVSFNKDII
ncbi:MAG TPA: arsenate reductase ArsC [Bacteroidales bacterium]|nr:arsenate reductase ArsC [Bacteroidales bacterium]